ncbi:peptidase A1 domain-containing protein [Citrus sinensis]|nr:peptidase A1 domain-containing protein [Citrus sinensis]
MDDWKPSPDGILLEEITTSDDERVVYRCFREASEVRTIERWEVECCDCHLEAQCVKLRMKVFDGSDEVYDEMPRIELTPRTSIDSALFPKDLSPEEIHHRIAQLSRVRALQLGSKQEPETLKPPVYPSPFANTNIYITKISIGSTQFSPYLVVDTGSDDTWLQCLCSYDWKYKEGSAIKGVLSSESFTFPGDKNTSLAFANVTFGCGYDNQNVSFDFGINSDNIIAGVFGLGAGQRSILRQLEPETNLRFSYCLRLYPTTDGRDEKRKVQTIKMNPSLPGYYVNVTGISIEGKRLEINPALFQLKQGGSGGFAIDSGVGPTLLVPEAYEVLKLEILEFYLARGFHPVKVLHVPYDLCYAITPSGGPTRGLDRACFLPVNGIHFEGADLFLDDTAVMGFVAPQLFCLIFLPTHPSGPNLLGAFQQENQRFLFDVGKSTVSFVSETCNEQE